MQIWEAREGWQEWQARTACKTRETWETRPVREACWQRVGATSANGLCVVVRHPRALGKIDPQAAKACEKAIGKTPGQNISAANWIRILTIHPYISWLPVTQTCKNSAAAPKTWEAYREGDRRQVSTEARDGFLNFGMFVIQVPVVWADPNLTIQFKRVIVTCLGWFLGWYGATARSKAKSIQKHKKPALPIRADH